MTRALVGEDVPVGLEPRAEVRLRPRARGLAARARGSPRALLPEVVRSGSRLGEVCAEAAAETGIPAGTPVIAGMTDGCAAQLAAGALREGDWNSVLGTTLVLKGYSSAIVRDPAGVLYCHRAPDGGWLPGGASSTGAGVLSARFAGRDLDELGRRAQAFEDTAVLAYPLVSRGRALPVRGARRRAVRARRAARRRPSCSPRCCWASRSSSGCASTTSTCSGRRRAAS